MLVEIYHPTVRMGREAEVTALLVYSAQLHSVPLRGSEYPNHHLGENELLVIIELRLICHGLIIWLTRQILVGRQKGRR